MKRTSTKLRKNRSNMNLEALEGRKLMSVAPFVVNGTAGNDVITVNYGLNLVLQQSAATTTTTTPVSTVKTPVVKANVTNMAQATVAPSSAAPAAAAMIFQSPVSTIMNRLTVTVNGVTTSTTLAPGQTIQVNGLAGNDKITVSGAVNAEINGGAGNDTLIGGSGNDSLNGGDGDDFLDGGLGADQISGGAGTDTVDYSSRSQNVTVILDGIADDGQAGEKDNVSSDIEVINGGWGNDFLEGNMNDTVGRVFNGNYGNDTIVGGMGNDQINGNIGDDYLAGGGGNDTIHGGAGNDLETGGAGDDVIYADSGNDEEFGDAGNDRLYGGTGYNYIHGGDGDDTIVTIGGSHSGQAFGDAGFDSFWLNSQSTDCVMDASAAEKATNVHRVAAYDALHVNGVNVGTPSLNMNVGNLPDPVAGYAYKNYASNPLFASGSPVVADENQGKLGDCYFMATLSSVAKVSPNVIKQHVVDLGDGTYCVDFKRDGVDHFIRVDADLPTSSYSNQPTYAYWRTSGHSMWVPIMEKAFAFFRQNVGCYSTIEGGFPSEVFNALGMGNNSYNPHHTGFLDLQSEGSQDFGNHIQSLLSQGDSVTLCTPGSGGYLENAHCYMVDHVNTIGGKVTSIVLRNPWGTDGPGGDGVNDGYVTLTNTDALASCDLIGYAHA